MNRKVDTPRTHCIRCGECCLGSSPTLQIEDVPLVKDGLIGKDALYTIRGGELVQDNVRNGLRVTQTEIIKIREKQDGACIFYDDGAKACRIYDHRPIQCVALACWDVSEFMEVYSRPKAGRRDIIGDKIFLGLIDKHESRCSYYRIEAFVKQIDQLGESAIKTLIEILKFDYYLRPFISEKLGLDFREMDFIFGRPLTETITMFGLQVKREPDGSFYLTTLNS